jgi:hypothetical protein
MAKIAVNHVEIAYLWNSVIRPTEHAETGVNVDSKEHFVTKVSACIHFVLYCDVLCNISCSIYFCVNVSAILSFYIFFLSFFIFLQVGI